jgi:diguanylate cyclase
MCAVCSPLPARRTSAGYGVETSDELVARADAALDTAKRTGRDRVEVAQPATDARLTPR